MRSMLDRSYSGRIVSCSACCGLAFFIVHPFSPRGLATADYPSLPLHITDDQEATPGRVADFQIALLTDGMVRIEESHREGIIEYRHRFLKGDAVLPLILSGLIPVPLK